MSKKTIQLDQQYTRASLDMQSYNSDNNTVEVVFATEARVKRNNWEIGEFIEVLKISKDAIDTTRLDAGAPVLDNHSRYSTSGVIGVVSKYWIDETKKEARAVLKLSNRPEISGTIQDIKEGILRGISVGYNISEYTVTEKEGETPVYTATRWQPMEISFAPVQADVQSGTRNNDKHFSNSVTINTNLMNEEQVRADEQEQPNEAATTTAPATETQPQPEPIPASEQEGERSVSERQRATDIMDACQRAGFDMSFARTLVNSGSTVSEARAAIINELHARSNSAPSNQNARVAGGAEDADHTREAIISGIMHRANPGSVDLKGNERAQVYGNMRLLDIAKDRLRAKGENFSLLSEQEVAKRALATTDFPNLLTNAVDRTLRRFYDSYVEDWKWMARRESMSDFREKTGIKIDGALTFEEIPEGGVYREAAMVSDDAAKLKLKKYGRKYSITDIAIANDDLGVFDRFPRMLAIGAQKFQSDVVWSLIVNNANAPDGVAMFHASHNNLGSAAAISEISLAAAKLAMRRQKSPSGEPLGISPVYLLVPPELEIAAQKAMTAILATSTNDVNVLAGSLQVKVSDALTDPKAWYVVADPQRTTADGIVYAYLNGQEGVKTDSRINWDTDSLEVKGSLAFAAAVWGWEGWYKNPGA